MAFHTAQPWASRLLHVAARLLVLTAVQALAGSEDARFKRLSGFQGAESDSKSIARDVACDFCKVASGRIAAKVARGTLHSEDAILEELGTFCSGREGGGDTESIDWVLEKEGWVVTDRGPEEGYRMEQRSESGETSLEDGGASLMGGFARRDSMKQACLLTVEAYASELAESLATAGRQHGSKTRKRQAPPAAANPSAPLLDAEAVSTRLCHDLSGVCSKRRARGRRRHKKREL